MFPFMLFLIKKITKFSIETLGFYFENDFLWMEKGVLISNMDGTALYEAVAAIYISQCVGMDLTIGQVILVRRVISLLCFVARRCTFRNVFCCWKDFFPLSLSLKN